MYNYSLTQVVLAIALWESIRSIIAFLSCIEKFFRKKSNPVKFEFLKWSLSCFKLMTHIICISITVEVMLSRDFSVIYFYLGLSFLLFGMLLRILSIISLGSMWSYRVALLEQHVVVNTGIYKYFRHPAYIGNIYLVGLALLFCAPISSFLAMFFIIVFSVLRVSKENQLIWGLKRVM